MKLEVIILALVALNKYNKMPKVFFEPLALAGRAL